MSMTRVFVVSLLGIVLAFQGCSDSLLFRGNSGTYAQKSENNGDGYTGKPTPYDFLDTRKVCTELGANGQPLPTNQIFLFPSGGAQLVRENCIDIPPRNLSSQEYSFESNGDILFN